MAQTARKKYIVITPFFPQEGNFRGAFIHDQVNAIRNLTNYEIIIYRPLQPWQSATDYIYDGFTIRWFKAALTPSFILSGIFNSLNSKIFYDKIIADGIAPNEIAAVHCHTSPCGAYGLKLKDENPTLKLLLQHHDPDPYNIRNGKFNDNKFNLILKAIFNNKLFPKFDCHVCVSKLVEDNLLNFPSYDGLFKDYQRKIKFFRKKGFKGAKNLNSLVLYNGVDLTIYNSNNHHRYSKNCLTIGCVGNFVDWKDQLTLLKALQYLRVIHPEIPIYIKFVGVGETLGTCKNFVSENNLSELCEFITEIPHEKLPEFYHSIDLFCLPSYFEGFGCVFTEAYACGTPYMICSGQGAAEYIPVDQKHIWEFEPRNYRELASKILNFYQTHPIQSIIHPIDINILVANFLKSQSLLNG